MDDVSRAKALKQRLAYVRIINVTGSSLPFRVERKRNGTMDGGPFLTQFEAEECILKLDLDKLAQKASRKTSNVDSRARNSVRPTRYTDR